MTIRQIKKDIFWVGAIDWDRRLFDELIPLPQGTSYNAYLLYGTEKTALIDTVYPPKASEMLQHLDQKEVLTLDYIIALHAEMDHSGAIGQLLSRYPMAKVVTNLKCKELLKSFLRVPEEKLLVVKDKETLALGNKTLEFHLAPWVHWPDTMFAYLKEDQILFSTDFFGAHLATTDLFVESPAEIERPAKRYYAEIMMPFRTQVRKHLEMVKGIAPALIAPSHGPLYQQPEIIMDFYADWASDRVKNEVVIPFVSMYHSTEKMVHYLTDRLVEQGIAVKPFNMSYSDTGEVAMALVDAATIVIGSPTVLTGAHPTMVYSTYLVNALRPKAKFGSIIGSYGWGGKMVDQLKGLLSNVSMELIDPVLVKGQPQEQDYQALDQLAAEIVTRHHSLDISG